MKRSLFILATLAMSSALYAQADAGNYTREKVLEIFSRYNPVVLEQARQNEDYRLILEGFLSSYSPAQTEQNRYELIAVARNFDNSIRLKQLTVEYEQTFVFAYMSGMDVAPVTMRFRNQLFPVFENIWAVTVQLRAYELENIEKQLKELKKDKTLSPQQRAEKEAFLQSRKDFLKQELKALQQQVGEQIQFSVDAYVLQAEQRLTAQLQSALAAQTAARASQARQTTNLQIKTKNKKPVAK